MLEAGWLLTRYTVPVHIMESHYGPLLSNPSNSEVHPADRVLTSVLAVASLRAQRGGGPFEASRLCLWIRAD